MEACDSPILLFCPNLGHIEVLGFVLLRGETQEEQVVKERNQELKDCEEKDDKGSIS